MIGFLAAAAFFLVLATLGGIVGKIIATLFFLSVALFTYLDYRVICEEDEKRYAARGPEPHLGKEQVGRREGAR